MQAFLPLLRDMYTTSPHIDSPEPVGTGEIRLVHSKDLRAWQAGEIATLKILSATRACARPHSCPTRTPRGLESLYV